MNDGPVVPTRQPATPGRPASAARQAAAWQICLGAGPAVIGLYFALASAGILPGLQVALFASANAIFAVAALIMAWRRPAMRAILALLGASAAARGTGDVLLYFDALVHRFLPYPGPADFYYLLAYPLLAAGLLLIVRRRTPGWDGASMIDAAIVAIGSGYVILLFQIVPGIDLTYRFTSLVAIAYPVGGLMVLAVGARLLLGAGPRSTALHLLGAALVTVSVADAVYGFQSQAGTFQVGTFLDAFWMTASLCFAAAVLHPSAPELIAPSRVTTPDASPGRLLVLALAAIIPPTTTIVQHYRDAEEYGVASAIVGNTVFLLALIRMALLVKAQRRDAVTDALTGLSSRRYFDQALGTIGARSARSGNPVSMLLLDIDHFKSVNDTYGHNGGDRVLVEVSNRLSHLVRPGDVVARYGGEEFAILLPDTQPEQARAVADRIRQGIADTPIEVNGTRLIQVTVSMGVAGMPSSPSTDALILAADQALYAAKHAGRNRVSCAPGATRPDRSTPVLPTETPESRTAVAVASTGIRTAATGTSADPRTAATTASTEVRTEVVVTSADLTGVG